MEATNSIPAQQEVAAAKSSSQSSVSRRISCVVCQQRKVKCDKQYPCSACERGHATCIYRTPAPPRRRKGRRELGSAVTETNLVARLKRYEELLRRLGVRLEDGDPTGGVGALNIHEDSSTVPKTEEVIVRDSELRSNTDERQGTIVGGNGAGKLVSGDGKSRLFESHMWSSLSDEFQDSKQILQSSSEDEEDDTLYGLPDLDASSLIFGSPAPNVDLRSLHPSPVLIFKLWQTFLDNFNPLVKILHTPTLQPLILDAAGNLENLPKTLETLLFAIYSSAVTTMSNSECINMAGETKSALLTRYHAATKTALINSGLLKSSEMLILQAYVLFLLSIRGVHDPRSLWTLTGIAVRIGQRIGLHRDGEDMNLPVFETEMRRRLWWQIIVLDTRTAELSGSGVSVLAHVWDTKIPLNVNDSDLYPQMKGSPPENTGTTEMIFCMLRYQMGEFFRRSSSASSLGGNWHYLSSPLVSAAEKDKTINEIEQLLEDKFLNYCDLDIPLHFLTSIVARAAVCKMRVLAHHPGKRARGHANMSTVEINLLFTNSLKIIEYDNLALSTKSISRFLWHVDVHFQWLAFVYLLSQLRCRTIGEEADRAWQQVGETYYNRPNIITDSKNALHVAIGNLTIKAWEARVAASSGINKYRCQENRPRFISTLYSRRSAIKEVSMAINPMPGSNATSHPTAFWGQAGYGMTLETSPLLHQNSLSTAPGYLDRSTFDPLVPDDVGPLPNSFSPMDWAQWDDLIRSHEL